MHILKTTFAVTALLAATLTPSFAESTNPNGSWKDKYGTAFEMSLCGDGTALCAILKDIKGKSRTEDNLALLNKQILKAKQVASNKWQGTVSLNGDHAPATVKQVGANTIEITGCKALVFCQTLVFNRI
jgi:hypothetical protein